MSGTPDPYPVAPAHAPLRGRVRPPGSKSLTCRTYLLAALARGESRLRSPLRSDDTDRLLAALNTLGVRSRWSGDDLVVSGCGGRLPLGGRIDLGDGGTPTRFMIAAACLAAAPVVVDGSPRMRERPVAEGVELLRQLGARIRYVEAEGRLPVEVTPSSAMRGGAVEVGETASSQFISALLLIGPFLPDGVVVRYAGTVTSPSYIALTRSTMRRFGAEVRDERWIGPRSDRVMPTPIDGRDVPIEADASSAVYWLAAGALVPDSEVWIEGVDPSSAQPDIGMLEVLRHAGADWVRHGDGVTIFGPPVLRGVEEDLSTMPDGALAVAAMASRAQGPTRLRGLRTLRVKESDRLTALATELRRIGCDASTTDDALSIDPRWADTTPVEIETYRDHRMAMAFAVLGLARPGIAIRDPECVAKSYPGFWNDLERVRGAPDGPPARASTLRP
ncbi:MAG: 3-phosphoshikimate 1-carboxyvinyltransferase [Phycisphaerales bacterium]|nr:3-phosphoshikimate 1-carboxyvinyltransferase [Phycisphaerales bacterium]